MARGDKTKTYEQAEAAQAKAVRFLRDAVGDEAKASAIEDLSVRDYADRKGFILPNPTPQPDPTEARGERMPEETIDINKLRKAEIVHELSDAEATMDEVLNQAIIAFDEGEISAEEALEVAAELLNEYDPDRFPMDSDEDDDDQLEASDEFDTELTER